MFAKLLLLFVFVPIIELSLFIYLGRYIGLPATLVIILLTGFLGAVLTKSQGGKALANFQTALSAGKMPAREIVDGLLILIAGAVLLTPGFLTDAIGFTLLIPKARSAVRALLSAKLAHKINVQVSGQPAAPADHDNNDTTGSSSSGKVIDV
jgi:UPF0716 protein FxsA